jgi:hypothetical protein
MATQQSDLVTQFLLSVQPQWLLDAYRVISQLKYPIPDRYSLKGQLGDNSEKRGTRGEQVKIASDLINSSLQPVDFPIQTPQSALEKLHARLFPDLEIGPDLDIPADSVETPGIAAIYIETFGPVCGAEAIEAYLGAIRGGLSELQAVIVGHQAGKRCRTSRLRPLPLPRRRRVP